MDSGSPPTDDRSDADDTQNECRVLEELQRTPEILSLINGWSGSELGLQTQLRRQFSDALVRAALTLAELRRKAIVKYSRADRMWFDRRGLEQSTSEPVAWHKAQRFEGHVWDLCCGIGGDALALAARGPTTAIDLNPAMLLRATWNVEAYDVGANLTTECRDVLTLENCGGLIHIDPDRRVGSAGKASRVEDYVPAPPQLAALMANSVGGAIKVGPASNFGGKFPGTEIELISLAGECKEATVWFGDLAGSQSFRATVLPAGASIAGDPLEHLADVTPVGRYVYDPDPAVVRAGLVDMLADQLGLTRLDSAEEYLTSDQLVASPFLHSFEIMAELPNREQDLRAWVKRSDFGYVEIKCRHIPIQAETVRRGLKFTGNRPGVVIFARLAGRSRILCALRVP